MMAFYTRLYHPLLKGALRHQAVVLLTAAVALLVGALFPVPHPGRRVHPHADRRRLCRGDAHAHRLLAELHHRAEPSRPAASSKSSFPKSRKWWPKSAPAKFPPTPCRWKPADLMIILKDQKDWTSAHTREELADKMAEALSVIPGVTFGFQQPIQMRFNELISGAKQDVVLKIYGEDLQQLADYAQQAGRLVRQVKGAEDVYVEQVTGLPQIVVQLDRNRLAQFGLNVADVNRTVQTAFAGETAGQVFEQERRFDLVLRLAPGPAQGHQQRAPAVHGRPQRPAGAPGAGGHRGAARRPQPDSARRRQAPHHAWPSTCGAATWKRVVKELQGKIDRQLKFAPGYYTTYGGQFENLRQATERLSIAVPVALLLIFVLLFFTFGSLQAVGADFHGHSALGHRRRAGAVAARHAVQHLGRRGLHCPVRGGRAQRHRAHRLLQPAQSRRRHRPVSSASCEGTEVRLRPGADDGHRGLAGLPAHGPGHIGRGRSAAPAGHRRHRRAGLGHAAHPAGAAGALRPLGARNSQSRRPENRSKPRGSARPCPWPRCCSCCCCCRCSGQAQGPLTAAAGRERRPCKPTARCWPAQRALEAQQAMRRTAYDLGRTTISGSYGQYNSQNRDNQFTITPVAGPARRVPQRRRPGRCPHCRPASRSWPRCRPNCAGRCA